MNKNIKQKIVETLAYDLAVFIDIFVSEKVKNNFDWINYFIYRNVINYSYMVSGEALYLNDFLDETKNQKEVDFDTLIKNFLKELSDYFKSEELFIAVKKELGDIKNER